MESHGVMSRNPCGAQWGFGATCHWGVWSVLRGISDVQLQGLFGNTVGNASWVHPEPLSEFQTTTNGYSITSQDPCRARLGRGLRVAVCHWGAQSVFGKVTDIQLRAFFGQKTDDDTSLIGGEETIETELASADDGSEDEEGFCRVEAGLYGVSNASSVSTWVIGDGRSKPWLLGIQGKHEDGSVLSNQTIDDASEDGITINKSSNSHSWTDVALGFFSALGLWTALRKAVDGAGWIQRTLKGREERKGTGNSSFFLTGGPCESSLVVPPRDIESRMKLFEKRLTQLERVSPLVEQQRYLEQLRVECQRMMERLKEILTPLVDNGQVEELIRELILQNFLSPDVLERSVRSIVEESIRTGTINQDLQRLVQAVLQNVNTEREEIREFLWLLRQKLAFESGREMIDLVINTVKVLQLMAVRVGGICAIAGEELDPYGEGLAAFTAIQEELAERDSERQPREEKIAALLRSIFQRKKTSYEAVESTAVTADQ